MKSKDFNNTALLAPVEPIFQALEAGHSEIRLVGLAGSAKAWVVAGIFQSTDRSLLIVLPTSDRSEVFHQDLGCWLEWMGASQEDLVYFPEMEVLPSEKTPPDPDLLRQCLRALYRMSQNGQRILITSASALTQHVPDRDAFLRRCIRLSTGKVFDREALLSQWVEMGYRRVDLVEHPAEFGVHGGLVDLFNPAEEDPVRIEWAGDTIESMRFFDPETQLSKREVLEIVILPIFGPLSDNATFPPGSFMDYLAPNTIQVWDEPESWKTNKLEGLLRPARTHALISFENISLEGNDAGKTANPFEVQYPIRSPGSLGLGLPGTPLTTAFAILQDLRRRSRVMVVAKSPTQQERLLALFGEHDLPSVRLTLDKQYSNVQHTSGAGLSETGAACQGPFIIAVGTLSDGFYDPDTRLAVFTDEDLFGKGIRHRPLPKPKPGRFISSLEDIRISDYIIHLQHGIGQYEGIRRQTIGGYESDFLVIRYLGGDVLYVPLDRLNLVQKYVGIEGRKPHLDRLGGWTWARTTRRAKKAVESIAKELLDLYAEREVRKGHAFSPDDHLSREFEAAFEFEETPDQLQALEDVKRAMESPRPMDRLICGDVGYGKTEVAMRASFKTVMDNRQVAVLVPTTLLAHQHCQTFRQRFSPFPVQVEMLSRFCTPQEQKLILTDLAMGKVDIAIGTHRLLQKDVQFKNLGLLIVDEEQRFGVTHKERLKQLRKSVDVLTLTATPIPRTLQMSLVGIRDLSIIETPPPDRLAIRTILARFDRQVIRTAILRELARGGQVFFVHNRIEDIEQIGRYLNELVPEVRLAIAHGQMRERALESVMIKFIRKEYDLLLCTAIIESGLDIPSANTILINNAHQFGLADLYQLRGRVGRSSQQAYAYLLVPSERVLTTKAKNRLSALQEFCELGTGFRIAARDLEIRGGGHLFGRQQSGQVAAVGFEYFLKLIEETIQELKGKPVEETREPILDLPVSAFIPDDYILDVHQRLSIYRRLSDILQEEDLSILWAELKDRYGSPPGPVEHLWGVVRLKLLARELGVIKLLSSSDGVAISFDPKRKLNDRQIEQLLTSQNGIRFLSEFCLKIPVPDTSWATMYSTLKNCLQRLLQYDTSSS